ncbi:unnamed protein product [Pedinophyceae sp. YPF-701]|nr:unnamed protein product [Pedinophyceae sp. YPF-701]
MALDRLRGATRQGALLCALLFAVASQGSLAVLVPGCGCTDVAPSADFSCAQQRDFGKCSFGFMQKAPPSGGSRFCEVTCGACACCTSPSELLGNLPTLVEAARGAGLLGALERPEFSGTLFAPTEAAFLGLLEDLGVSKDALLGNKVLLGDVLKYHVVPGRAAKAADLEDGQSLTTLGGTTLTVNRGESGVRIVGRGSSAAVTSPDALSCYGVVHTIDAVLLPTAADDTTVREATETVDTPGGSQTTTTRTVEGPGVASAEVTSRGTGTVTSSASSVARGGSRGSARAGP